MRGVNMVILRGYTGNDADVYDGDGFKIANVRLATDESYVNRDGEKIEDTQWHNLVFRNTLARVIEEHAPKGSHIEVVGRLRHESWNKEDGSTGYSTKIHVDQLYFVSTPSEEDGSEGTKSTAKAKTTAKKATSNRATSTGRKATQKKAVAEPDDDLPY